MPIITVALTLNNKRKLLWQLQTTPFPRPLQQLCRIDLQTIFSSAKLPAPKLHESAISSPCSKERQSYMGVLSTSTRKLRRAQVQKESSDEFCRYQLILTVIKTHKEYQWLNTTQYLSLYKHLPFDVQLKSICYLIHFLKLTTYHISFNISHEHYQFRNLIIWSKNTLN